MLGRFNSAKGDSRVVSPDFPFPVKELGVRKLLRRILAELTAIRKLLEANGSAK